MTSCRELLSFPLVVGLTLPLVLSGCAGIIGRRAMPPPAPAVIPVPPPAEKTAPVTKQMGEASWYGPGFHGQKTASGETYDQRELTAAHPILPLGSEVVVTNLDTGKSVEVRINDRGPSIDGRVIDLSHAAAQKIGLVKEGTAPVRIEVSPPARSSTVTRLPKSRKAKSHTKGRKRRNSRKTAQIVRSAPRHEPESGKLHERREESPSQNQ